MKNSKFKIKKFPSWEGLGVGMLLLLISCSPIIHEKITIRDRIDTLFVPGDTIRIESAATLLQDSGFTRQDSVSPVFENRRQLVEQHPFTARLDTIVDRVTMNLEYRFPANFWNINITKPDTVLLHHFMDTSTTNILEKPVPYVPWWCYVCLVVVGGLIVMFFIKR